MHEYTECDMVFIDKTAERYGFAINEDLQMQEL